MRNLDEFIADYFYDMQNQEFFKKTGKKVETLTVNHMVNALRTHGIGIVYISVSSIFYISVLFKEAITSSAPHHLWD